MDTINNGVHGPFPLPVESTADIRSVHSAETIISMRWFIGSHGNKDIALLSIMK